jgi:RNA polymerase sigma-70 factor (ECF subfamily)
MNEKDAIARLQQGDLGGLEALVHRYQARAVRVAYLITRDAALAEDIVQAAFVRACQRISQFDARRPFGPWFLQVVANDALKAAARGQREASLEERMPSAGESLASPYPGPAQLLEHAETREEMWQALGKLSPELRTTVVLHYYLGLTESEASERLGCPKGTIRSRLHAARQRLRWLLRDTTQHPGEAQAGNLFKQARRITHTRGGE